MSPIILKITPPKDGEVGWWEKEYVRPKRKKPRRRQNRRQHRQEYEQYIRGPVWKAKRQQAFKHYGRKCWTCGNTDRLEVHHLTYVRLFGDEMMIDLRILCRNCHKYAHGR